MEDSIPKKKATPVIDSRFLKILAAKKEDLQDALIFVTLDEEKYGLLDKAQLTKVLHTLEKIAPDSVWFGSTKKFGVSIIKKDDLKNKDLLVTVRYEDLELADEDATEEMFRKALPEARDISFIHTDNWSQIEEDEF